MNVTESGTHFDVVIIGAGIVGAACALVCTRRGLRAAVVERDSVGGGATSAGMGHVVIMSDSPAQLVLTEYSQRLWRELAPQLPAGAEYDACGTLWIAADEEEMQEIFRKQALYAAAGVPAEALDAASLAEAEPHLAPGLIGALRVPLDGVLEPPRAAAWMIEQAVRGGAVLYRPRTVIHAARGCVRLDDGSSLYAEHIVVASGADAGRLLPGLPLRRRKGHVVITDQYPALVRHQLVELGYLKSAHSSTGDSVAFNVQPRKTGRLLIGSSRQQEAENAGVDKDILAAMLARAAVYLPQLATLKDMRVRTGFRAATSDNLPLIGPWAEDESILLATGHEGLGITTAPGTAEIIAAYLTGSTPAIPAEPYLPSRTSNDERM